MPFRRRGLPGPSRKHEITWSLLSLDAATVQTIVIAKGTQAADITDATALEVKSGATIRAIFFEFHFSPEVITNAKVIHWTIGLEPFGTSLGNAINYQTVQRRFIFKRGMEMLPKDLGTVFKRVFVVKIPPKFQRLGIADEIVFKFQASSTQAINACGIAVYRAGND